ncbi:MAG: sensor histidine kinase [Candidatus Paceibacterota bacterium]
MKEEGKQILLSALGAVLGIALALLVLDVWMHNSATVTEFERRALIVLLGFGGFFLTALFLILHNMHVLRRGQSVREEALKLILHEMRTALTATGWSIEMVLEKYGDPIIEEDKKMLKGIIKSIHASVQHSMDLLGVSTVKKEEFDLSLSTIDPEEVFRMVKELVENYQLGAKQKGIDLAFDAQITSGKRVEIDLDRIRVVLENLLENALAYTPPHGKIWVKMENPNNHIRFEVKDTGMGVPEKDKLTLFQEFYRGSNARKNMNAGSGIGLYTCKKYIEAHGGTIGFVSTEGQGATFYFDIPQNTNADVQQFLKDI